MSAVAVAVARPLIMRCTIASSPAWAGWAGRDAALAGLRAALAPALAAWRLPLRPALAWHADRTDGWPADTVLRLRFDADGSSVHVLVPGPAAATPQQVAEVLAHAALALRTAWLMPALLHRLGRSDSELAPLREGARRGFAPWRFAGAGAVPVAMSVEERCDCELDAPALRLRLQLAEATTSLDQQDADASRWDEMVEQMRDTLFADLGMLLPPLELETDPTLPANALRVCINDLPLGAVTGLAPGRMFVAAPLARVASLGLTGEPMRHPLSGEWHAELGAGEAERRRVQAADMAAHGRGAYAIMVVAAALRDHVSAFWSLSATEAVLDRLAATTPARSLAWRQRFAPALLCVLLRRLLDERLSIRPLGMILDAMLAVQSVAAFDMTQRAVFAPPTGHVCTRDVLAGPKAAAPMDIDDWVEHVRIALRDGTVYALSRGENTLHAILLPPELLRRLRDEPATLAAADARQRLYAGLHQALAQAAPGTAPVLLTYKGARAPLRRLIAADWPGLPVLSYEELPPHANVKPIATLSWNP